MNLDDLRAEWAERDGKLGQAVGLDASKLRECAAVQKGSSALRRLSRLLAIELALDAAVACALGAFIAGGAQTPAFIAPAVVLGWVAIASLVFAARQLVLISRVDFGAPVAVTQTKLERLRIERIRVARWILLLAPLLWVPLFIVAMKATFDVDVYTAFGGAWLVANLALGLALLAFALWASKRYADRLERSPLMRRLANDLAGRSLAAALAALETFSPHEDD